ncbi:MAG TPA: phosphoribosyl-AMP cyclohydrolase [Candidatus Eisenbacteria bacterium]|jgi:phosphoribosyl-ATP pyrophosphohydrolase/phosphoribosyl-AMP cyclohydrolase
MLDPGSLDFAKGEGLITVVVQDAATGAVLMVAHADREAVEKTLATGEMHYRSRTRGPWRKGETSGNVQRVVSLATDCDRDALLARVTPAGPACHTGAVSCFGEAALSADAIASLARVIAERAAGAERAPGANAAPGASPAPGAGEGGGRPSYTRTLLADRNLRLKKLGEEAAELVTACADGDRARAAEEGVDLLYHALVALHAVGVSLDDLRRVVAGRAAAGGEAPHA